MKKYKVLAICGKAGCGKSALLKTIFKEGRLPAHEIVSYTSREPRSNEVDGVNYHFIDKWTFADKIHKGEMLEHALFNGWLYGTAIDSLVDDKINVGIFNPQGVISLMRRPDIDLYVIYIWTPDSQRLMRQLSREDNPDVREILRRYDTDEDDFYLFEQNTIGQLEHFLRIENDDGNFDETVTQAMTFLGKIV